MDTPKPTKSVPSKPNIKRPEFSFSDEELRKHIEEIEEWDTKLSDQEHLELLRKNAIDLDDLDETP